MSNKVPLIERIPQPAEIQAELRQNLPPVAFAAPAAEHAQGANELRQQRASKTDGDGHADG